MIIYRAMCDSEFQDMQHFNSLSWNSRFKWFGTKEFVIERVMDKKFNNSKFINRYNNLVKFEFSNDSVFTHCGNREFMLARKDAPKTKLISWELQ